MTAPYPDAASYDLTKVVNLVQLTDELSAEAGQTVTLAITGDESFDPLQPISVDNPMTLWVVPNSVDFGVVTNVVTAHIPDPVYNVAATDLAFNDAIAKVKENFDVVLTDEEKDVLLKGLALRVGPHFSEHLGLETP